MRTRGRASFGMEKGTTVLGCAWWHRIVCDEFHELGHSKTQRSAANAFQNLSATHYLGVTGTPKYDDIESIHRMAGYLDCELPAVDEAALEFLQQRVRRNEPALHLNPLVQECHWVEMSAAERVVYHHLENVDSLMACNHHHLAGDVVRIVGDNEDVTVEQVAQRVQGDRRTQITRHDSTLVRLDAQEKRVRRELKDLTAQQNQGFLTVKKDEKDVPIKQEIRSRQESLSKILKQIESNRNERNQLQAQFNFVEAVLTAGDEDRNCLICLEPIANGDRVAMAFCGHLHCPACMDALLIQPQPRCSMCRVPLEHQKVLRFMLKNKFDEVQQEEENAAEEPQAIDRSRYGAKLAAFTEFLIKTTSEDSNAKIILFIQWRRLMNLVSLALKDFGIEHVICVGNVMTRTRAVKLFKTSDKMRLILLSSEDSVSGLNLTEATHVVIFHPFLMPTDERAMAYEKQGIARAWRSGQTKQVKVVRFLCRDTVEEKMALR